VVLFLAGVNNPLPVQLELDLPTFGEFADAYQARWTVVRMWYEGWNKKSIAGCLKLARSHVYAILEAFARDGFAGLEDQRTRPAQHPENQLDLPFLKAVLEAIRKLFRSTATRLRSILAVMKHRTTTMSESVQHKLDMTDLNHGRTGFYTALIVLTNRWC
jgi:transposase